MRSWWVLVACGCLSKPAPPGLAGDGSMPPHDAPPGTEPCVPAPVSETFDSASPGDCGPSLMTNGDAMTSRAAGQLVFTMTAYQDEHCSALPFDIRNGVMIEVMPGDIQAGDGIHFDVIQSSNGAILLFDNGVLSLTDSGGSVMSQVNTVTSPRWWRLVPAAQGMIAAATSSDGRQWTPQGVVITAVDITQPFAVDFGVTAGPAALSRPFMFDNFDVCPSAN